MYPWHFVASHGIQYPFRTLLYLGRIPFNRFMVRDAIVNLALYLPLGMSGYLAARRRRIWRPLLGGLLLSCLMEFIQQFEPSRNSSALDVVTNVAGTAFGIGLGMVFEGILPEGMLQAAGSLRVADRSALALAFVWAGYLTFPWFPLVGLYTPRHKLALFLAGSRFAPIPLISAAAVWFVAGRLLQRSGFPGVKKWLPAALLVIPAQLFLVDRQPAVADLIGAVAGVGLFLISGSASLVEGMLFLVLIAFRGLSPFDLSATVNHFNWIPFSGFLNTQWQAGLLVLLEKCFYYGSGIWLLRTGGLKPRTATAIVAVVLAGIEIAQIHLPGRTAETTDPILAVLLGIGLSSLAERSA